MRKLALLPVLAVIVAAAPAGPPPQAAPVPAAVPVPIDRPLAAEAAEREARAQLGLARKRARRARLERPVAVPPHLQSIAQCESGGDPRAIGGGGLYRGKYQFSVATWQSVGGKGDPAAAPEAEQDRRAIILYERSGPGQWPVCGS